MAIYREPSDASPALVQYGHTKSISAMVYANGSLFSSAFEDSTGTVKGQLLQWDVKSGVATGFEGELHSNMIIGLGFPSSGDLVTCGADDSVAFIKPSTPLEMRGDKVQIGAAPKSFGCGSAIAAVVTTTDKLVVISTAEKKIAKEVKLPYSPTCVAVALNDGIIAIGGEDNVVHVVDANGAEKFALARHRDHVSTVAISPQSDKLASGCNNKEVVVWSAVDGTPLVTGLSGFHTARIYCLAWAPDNNGLASGGVDATIILWDLEAKRAKETIKNAHTGGAIRALTFADSNTLFSAGQDANIKKWTVAGGAVDLS